MKAVGGTPEKIIDRTWQKRALEAEVDAMDGAGKHERAHDAGSDARGEGGSSRSPGDGPAGR